MRPRWLVAVLLVSLAWVAGGCGRGNPSVTEPQVAAGVHEEALRAGGLGAPELREAARAALRDAGFRVVRAGGDYRARVEVLSVDASGSDRGAYEIEVELQLLGVNAGPLRSLADAGVGRAPRPAPGEREGQAWHEAFSAAVADASERLRRSLAAEGQPTEKLLRALEAEDPRLREEAIRVLGERRSREAVPGLIARLRDPDLRLAERAAGALAQIGDPRAVGPIIDFTQRLDEGPYTPRYARIIGDLGGSEARGYLLTLESGQVHPEVREAAREALRDLEAREREQAALARPPRSTTRDSGRMER
ncbi:MAG TPA: HEAT repeat domain-containing protein [Anaeromyxobacter sp.]|nr:HEAT repeat domain-containing protein [Anaeromyxobacter sp.]